MAEESMLDKAIGMIPGMGGTKKKRRKPAQTSTAAGIASLKKGMAKLAADFERLVGIVGKQSSAKKAPARKTAAKRSTRKPAAAKRGAAKKPPARKA